MPGFVRVLGCKAWVLFMADNNSTNWEPAQPMGRVQSLLAFLWTLRNPPLCFGWFFPLFQMFAHLYIPSCFILQLGIAYAGEKTLETHPHYPNLSLDLLEISKKYILILSLGAKEHSDTIFLPSLISPVTFSKPWYIWQFGSVVKSMKYFISCNSKPCLFWGLRLNLTRENSYFQLEFFFLLNPIMFKNMQMELWHVV